MTDEQLQLLASLGEARSALAALARRSAEVADEDEDTENPDDE